MRCRRRRFPAATSIATGSARTASSPSSRWALRWRLSTASGTRGRPTGRRSLQPCSMTELYICREPYDDDAKAWLGRSGHYLENPPPGCLFCVVVRGGGARSFWRHHGERAAPRAVPCWAAGGEDVAARRQRRRDHAYGATAGTAARHGVARAYRRCGPCKSARHDEPDRVPRPHATYRMHLSQGWVPQGRGNASVDGCGMGQPRWAHVFDL